MKFSAQLELAAGTLSVMCLLSSIANGDEPQDENPVLEVPTLVSEGTNLTFQSTLALPLYADRRAARKLDVLAPQQSLTVLAMDRHGLQVRGKGRNGAVSGWIGQKKAFAKYPKQLEVLTAWYDRQLEVEQLVEDKKPAIGMNIHELKRVLGKPTSQDIGAEQGVEKRTLVWVISEEVDLNDALALGTDAAVLKLNVDVGRIEADLVNGIVTAIRMNAEGAPDEIASVPVPVQDLFGPTAEAKAKEPPTEPIAEKEKEKEEKPDPEPVVENKE